MKDSIIVLASGSPRRREILSNIGLTFTVITSDADEVITKDDPYDIVCELAYAKCMEVTERIIHNTELSDTAKRTIYVIGADTMVFHNDKHMGKPKDRKDAIRMIKDISGDTHQVLTGVCISKLEYINDTYECTAHSSFAETTDVDVSDMTEDEIIKYIETLEYTDKAGGYAIQGYFSRYIKGIHGDYFNVVGLPACRLYHELASL
ncbi:MAG: septum formation protein Maf [Lachnospiraceae bacterium]|nr:septum formation protein Maf [Lachnospiraceae bacterium]